MERKDVNVNVDVLKLKTKDLFEALRKEREQRLQKEVKNNG